MTRDPRRSVATDAATDRPGSAARVAMIPIRHRRSSTGHEARRSPFAALGPEPAGASRLHALVRAVRPRQWLKNVLVFAAPAAAGVIDRLVPFGRTAVTFVIFSAAAASVYLVNDVVDRESDRVHPLKQHRPIASGALSVRFAIGAAAVLAVLSLVASALLATALVAIVATYLVLSLSYTFGLKRVPLVEMALVSSGFTLRAVAGGAANHVPISPWFLVMTSFGALFIVAGKRTSEQAVLGDEQVSHRSALGAYPRLFMTSVRLIAISVTVTTYCLWAFERASHLRPSGQSDDVIWFELSIIPFALAVLAVELAIEKGRGGEPEELALTDRGLQAFGLIWVVLVAIGLYG
jgi:decaprenyl-phosphate phosphoribosyltransferase